jgi:hypothetical protein
LAARLTLALAATFLPAAFRWPLRQAWRRPREAQLRSAGPRLIFTRIPVTTLAKFRPIAGGRTAMTMATMRALRLAGLRTWGALLGHGRITIPRPLR